jgi:HSP20 family protein
MTHFVTRQTQFADQKEECTMIIRRMWPTYGPWRGSFGQLEDMRRDMQRLFDALEGSGREYTGVFPPMNITQDADNFYLRADLPGMNIDDLELTALRNRVSISGKREIAAEEASYHRREREGGAFSRSVTLPTEIDGSRVEAHYKDGVLTVVLPKQEEAKPRQIAVKSS